MIASTQVKRTGLFSVSGYLWHSVFLFAFLICDANTASGQTDIAPLAQLREIEEKVKRVAEETTGACVAIVSEARREDGKFIPGSAGSGVIISQDGVVLTAGHVMTPGTEEYQILFADGRSARAIPLGSNLNVDSGMVRITDPGPWPFVDIGKSEELNKGDWVVSLGHSGGFELGRNPPVRTGRILGRNDFQVETDAVLIGGDSGGPLFNLDGELVGIHSSIGDSVAENRHVTTETFMKDFDRLKRGENWGQLPKLLNENDGTKPPKMGIVINRQTAEVTLVRKNSPAASIGIRKGDVILKFDGELLENGQQLIDMVKNKISGDVVRIVFSQNGKIIDKEIRLR